MMEIKREQDEIQTISGQIPSAPDLDQESLSNVIDDNWQIPERVERAQPISIWNRIKRSFSKYKPLDEVTPVQFNSTVGDAISPNQIQSNSISNPQIDPIFGNLNNRNSFLRVLYMLLFSQMSLFTSLAALFYYIPHLRKIFRTTFADKIFYRSMFGAPIGIVFFLVLFESIRRRYAFFFVIALTACLSCLLCYVMSYQSDNLFLLMELALTDGCFASAGLINLIIPKFALRHRFETIFFPLFMIAGQGLQPFLLKKHLTSTWFKNLFFVGSTSYLGYNVGSIMNNDKLALKSNEFSFAVLQSYINLNPIESATNLFRNRRRSNFERI